MPNEKSNHNTNTDFLVQGVSPGEEYGGWLRNKDCRNIIVKDRPPVCINSESKIIILVR